jgi:hypothetical protein
MRVSVELDRLPFQRGPVLIVSDASDDMPELHRRPEARQEEPAG